MQSSKGGRDTCATSNSACVDLRSLVYIGFAGCERVRVELDSVRVLERIIESGRSLESILVNQ